MLDRVLSVTLRFEPDRLRRSANPTAVHVGPWSHGAGLPLLLDAFDEVRAVTGADLLLAGDGPLARRVRRHADDRPYVRLLRLDHADAIAHALAYATIAVWPGDAPSVAVAAAMACRTPVLAADGTASGRLVAAAGGGATFRAGDGAAFAAAAIALLTAPAEARDDLGRRGRAHIALDHTGHAHAADGREVRACSR
jgi:alpha-1,6-mannosyltransferase